MLEWSDDDEDQSVLPLSTKGASTDAEALKQQARESYVRATIEIPATQTTRVPEQQEGITAEPHAEGGALGRREEQQPAAEA